MTGKIMSAAPDVAFRGISLRNVKRPRLMTKKKIYAMKKLGTFEAKKTEVMSAVVKGTT